MLDLADIERSATWPVHLFKCPHHSQTRVCESIQVRSCMRRCSTCVDVLWSAKVRCRRNERMYCGKLPLLRAVALYYLTSSTFDCAITFQWNIWLFRLLEDSIRNNWLFTAASEGKNWRERIGPCTAKCVLIKISGLKRIKMGLGLTNSVKNLQQTTRQVGVPDRREAVSWNNLIFGVVCKHEGHWLLDSLKSWTDTDCCGNNRDHYHVVICTSVMPEVCY